MKSKKKKSVICIRCQLPCTSHTIPDYILDNALEIETVCPSCEKKMQDENNVDDSAMTFFEKMIRDKDEIIKKLNQRITELENKK